MNATVVETDEVRDLLVKVSGADRPNGDPRMKQVVERVIRDIFKIIEDLDISPSEFWTAISYFTSLGQANEWALVVPGVGIERFFDILMDEKERTAGLSGGTPRTIEGPLWVEGAPLVKGKARLDDGSEEGETLIMEGVVCDASGAPIPGACVDVWHAGPRGGYSFFDKGQTPWNLRRRIEVGADGRYTFRPIVPAGYSLPPSGPSQQLMNVLGRHGHRPAHIHFFVSASGYRKLTTQLNIPGDPYLWDDFAIATREGLIAKVKRHGQGEVNREHDWSGPYAAIRFDFTLQKANAALPSLSVQRAHLQAPAAT